MDSYTDWFTTGRNRKIQINSIAIYRNLSSQIVTKLDNNLSVSEIINWIKSETIQAFSAKYNKNPEVGALCQTHKSKAREQMNYIQNF